MPLLAQDALTIMTSDSYKWAVGEGATAAEAKENAKKELLNSIITNVISSVSLNEAESLDKESSEYQSLFNSYTRSYSRLQLKNLKVIELDNEEGSSRALAYILVSDYLSSIEDTKINIREMVRLAETKESSDGIISAFYGYYLAYLNTFYSPEPVEYFSQATGDSISSVRVLLESKLRGFLSAVKVLPGAPKITPGLEEQIEIPVSVFYKNVPVSKLALKIDVTDSPKRTVRNGKTELILYSQPSSKKQKLRLLISPAFEEESELKELHQQFALTEKSEMTVDFSNVVKADFSFKAESNTVYAFTSEVKNLSISRIEWDFGDGEGSQDMNPKHLYKSGGVFNVTLQLNSDPTLKITRQVKVAGKESPQPAKPEPPVTEAKQPEEKISITPEPVKTGVISKTAETLTEAILRVTQFREVKDILDSYKAKGLLSFGKKKDFVSPENCFIIIFDPVTGEMKALLEPAAGARRDLMTGSAVSNITNAYKGMTSIWVEVYK